MAAFRSALICSLSLAGASLFSCPGRAQTPAPKPAAGVQNPAPKASPATQAPQDELIPPAAPGAFYPALAARVNGKPILGRDLERLVRGELATIGNPSWTNLRDEYRQDLTSKHLGALIASELMYQKAVAGGLKAADTEVQAELAKIVKSYPSDADMNAALARQGMDRARLVKDLERSLIVNRFIQDNAAKKAAVTPNELSEYYAGHTEEFRHPDMVRTSHILITVKQGATQEQDKQARQRAVELLARAKKGEDFAKLAKENSEDPSAPQGGDIGYISNGDAAPEYEAAAFALEPGAVSEVVRTDFGYHIIKVTDKKKAGVSTLDEARAELTAFLKNQKAQAELGKIVDGLRAQAKIEVFLPPGALPSSDSVAPSPVPPVR
jgi:peptidyl-prolyl cis-trans isomerase C